MIPPFWLQLSAAFLNRITQSNGRATAKIREMFILVRKLRRLRTYDRHGGRASRKVLGAQNRCRVGREV